MIKKDLYCINFTRWKQRYIKAFLKNEGNVIFISSFEQAVKKGFNTSSQLVSWASKDKLETDKFVTAFGTNVWQIEDGFIRSAGLGSDLTAPASLVLDKRGIYYDPSSVSDLEKILQDKVFSKQELKQANELKNSLIERELSKYNLGKRIPKSLLNTYPGQKIILIPGQVENDASIKRGCIDIKTNSSLLREVRRQEPDSYIIYKPHPDVVSGNRKGKVSNKTVTENCDLVLMDASITDCLSVVHEVHTMTSLVGFEGLLRGLKVYCYGLPFYSGWGLTRDRHTIDRRSRQLELDELVAGTLIDYPYYINWKTGHLTTPEVIIHQLEQQIKQQGGKQANQVFWLNRKLNKVKNFLLGVLRF